MMRRGALLSAATFACALALLPGNALAAGGDAAATHGYLVADHALVRTATSHFGVARAAFASLLHRLRSECPQVAAESPQNEESTQLSNELIGAMVLGAYRPDRQHIQAFIAATRSLRWGSAAITRWVRQYDRSLSTLLALAQPDVCRDTRAWVTGGYRSLPASTIAFDARFIPSWVSLGEMPPGLSRLVSSQDRGLFGDTQNGEQQITDFEAGAAETWRAGMIALALNP
jgi:hypothetical protein